MQQPLGFKDHNKPYLVCKLRKALYGLKQAPRAWFDKLKHSLLQIGFVNSKADNSLFIKYTKVSCVFILVYVDDIIITGSHNKEVCNLIIILNRVFSLKDLGNLHFFLGIEVTPTTTGLHLSQKKYIGDLLKRAKMDNAKPLPTPMISGLHLSTTNGSPIEDGKQYRSWVGALQYATITRPQISYSVNQLSQFMHCPLDQHWKAIKRVLRYLKRTINYGLNFTRSKTLNLTRFSDADWVTDVDDWRSTLGLCIFLGNNLIT